MDRIQREFRANKKARTKVRLAALMLPVVALTLDYLLWPGHITHTVLAFLRISIAGLILVAMLMAEHMLLTE